MVEIQSLPTLVKDDPRVGGGTQRPEGVVRFSPPGHFGPSEVVDPGTFEISSDGFRTTHTALPPSQVPGVSCRYRSHGMQRQHTYTGGVPYVVAPLTH